MKKPAFMKKPALRQILLLLVLHALVVSQLRAQQSCQPPALPVPIAGENIFSEQQEMDLGDAVAEHLRRNVQIIDDDEVTKYLRAIGERLIKGLPPTKLKFQFFLFDINDVNAFTLPGGRIFVSRKMVAFARNEDELAGVVAHELGHIVARHSTMDMTILMREILGVTQVTDRRDIFEKYNQFIENTARKPKVFEKLDNHESGNQNAADLIGLHAMVRAGYDPQAQAALWDRYHELKGKTGGFFADLFGRTKPEQKRLREMLRGLKTLPPECLAASRSDNDAEFRQWQASVVSYTGLGGKESLTGVITRKSLTPALRSDINHTRFSPDGKFLLVQDDSGINVVSREPLAPLFRIDAPDAKPAQFTPDSRLVVFHTSNMRFESWDVAEQKLKNAYEVVVRKSCIQTALSPDGKEIACLDSDLGLNLIDVATSASIYEKKSFTHVGFFEALSFLLASLMAGDDDAPRTENEIVNMTFSPDGHYFVAGDRSVNFTGLGIATEIQALVLDLTTRAVVPVKGDLKKIIGGGFAFVGPDKVVGKNWESGKKSGLYNFPSGEVVENFEMFTSSIGPVTSGNYVLLRNFGKLSGAMLDLSTRKVFNINDRAVMDLYQDVAAVEQQNSELGLFNMKNGAVQRLILPQNPLGRLYAVDITPDFTWLAVSGYSRGAVWNLAQGKMALYLRGFRGAHLDTDKSLYADFPKLGEVERNVARLTLTDRQATAGMTIDDSSARQYGPVVVRLKPAKKDGSYWENVVMEVLDAKTLAPSWSMNFLKERPGYWVSPREGTMTLVWPATSKAAAADIKASPELSRQMSALKEKQGDYLLKVIDLNKGQPLGEFLLETGKGSFRIKIVVASGDRVAVSDNQNRTLVYSLASGQQLGKVFGTWAALSTAGNLLCVESKDGLLELYDMTSFEKRQQYSFGGRLSLVRFSPDGKRLLVLTANQTVYLLDVAKPSP
jgi:beta-barrel assembly-enhancing protease